MTEIQMFNTFRSAVQKGVKPVQEPRARSAGMQDVRISRGVLGGADAMRSAGVQRRY